MTRVHAWLLSDAPGAAHAFAGLLLGSIFAGIVAFVTVATIVVEAVR